MKTIVEKYEQETSICIDPNTKRAEVYSSIPSTVKQLQKLVEESSPNDVKVIRNDKYGITIDVPAKWIKIQKPRTKNLTEEQKEALRQRMSNARKMKNEPRTES